MLNVLYNSLTCTLAVAKVLYSVATFTHSLTHWTWRRMSRTSVILAGSCLFLHIHSAGYVQMCRSMFDVTLIRHMMSHVIPWPVSVKSVFPSQFCDYSWSELPEKPPCASIKTLVIFCESWRTRRISVVCIADSRLRIFYGNGGTTIDSTSSACHLSFTRRSFAFFSGKLTNPHFDFWTRGNEIIWQFCDN